MKDSGQYNKIRPQYQRLNSCPPTRWLVLSFWKIKSVHSCLDVVKQMNNSVYQMALLYNIPSY